MRNLGFATAFALVVFACSSAPSSEPEVDVGALTDNDLAKSALKIMGAPQVRSANSPPSCGFTGCHSINPVTLNQWNDQYKAAMTFLGGSASTTDKVNYFRQNPVDDRTGFTPERIGIMAAGAHLALGANVDATRHPETFKQGKMLADLFQGQDDLYANFRQEMLMPVLPQFSRLSAVEYETILTWFKKGMPQLSQIIQENRPTDCTDDFDGLRAHASEVKGANWTAQNKSNGLVKMGCDPSMTSPTQCLAAQAGGQDVFPKSSDTDFAKTWAADGSTVRVMRELKWPNSFWMRSSADGRFVATGGGQSGGAQAIDLQATLDGQSRNIGLSASYDPDFWPDNKAFMFQGGTKFCAQSLLEKASTTQVTFGEPECSNLNSAAGLYQTVGQTLGDNSIGDRFILYSIWAGDSGQYSAAARDTVPRAGADAGINIFVAVAKGNDVTDGYQVKGNGTQLPTPYQGDTMMARSGKIIGSRVAGEHGALGYAIQKLNPTVSGGNYRFGLTDLGKICMKGNKANISFDERFLVTHHYNEPADYDANDDPAYHDKGSSDVIMADFVTGKKTTITKMGPGQFALYPHFRSDGWLYFLVVDHNTGKYYVTASDWAVRQVEANPTP